MSANRNAYYGIRALDEFSRSQSSIHHLTPIAKVVTTLIFIIVVVSFSKYAISAMMPLILYPLVLATLSRVPAGLLFRRMLLAFPFAFFIGIFNPLYDQMIVTRIGSMPVSGGWISFLSIQLRFLLTVSAGLILIAVTGMDGIRDALTHLRVPSVFTTQLLFLHRYIFVLGDEALRLKRAYALRAPDKPVPTLHVFRSLAGQWMLRSIDRAERIHYAMLCRGFSGEIRVNRRHVMRVPDLVFMIGWPAYFLICRYVDIPHLIGKGLLEFTS